MSKKGGKSTPSKGEKGDKTRTTPTNELVPGILDNEEHFSKYRGGSPDPSCEPSSANGRY